MASLLTIDALLAHLKITTIQYLSEQNLIGILKYGNSALEVLGIKRGRPCGLYTYWRI